MPHQPQLNTQQFWIFVIHWVIMWMNVLCNTNFVSLMLIIEFHPFKISLTWIVQVHVTGLNLFFCFKCISQKDSMQCSLEARCASVLEWCKCSTEFVSLLSWWLHSKKWYVPSANWKLNWYMYLDTAGSSNVSLFLHGTPAEANTPATIIKYVPVTQSHKDLAFVLGVLSTSMFDLSPI